MHELLNLNNKVDNNLKVLIDPIYGTGIITLRKMCEMLNIHNYKMIEDKHEAFFNFKMPNPTIKNMITALNIIFAESLLVAYSSSILMISSLLLTLYKYLFIKGVFINLM